MAMKVIMLVCLCPFFFIMYFILKYYMQPNQKYCCGVTLTKEQREDEAVQRIVAGCTPAMRRQLAVLLILSLLSCLIPWDSVFIFAFMMLTLYSVFCFYVPFVKANIQLKRLKQERGWKQAAGGQTYVELGPVTGVRRVKFLQFLPAILISLALFGIALWRGGEERIYTYAGIVGTLALLTPLFYLAALLMDRQKVDVISLESDVNLNYARAKKEQWKNFWVICAWLNTVYTACTLLFFCFERVRFDLFIAASVVYTVIPAILLLRLLKESQKLDRIYEAKRDIAETDDDDHWIGGFLYYNPKDGHSMVNVRYGMGTTCNMAKPLGKGMIIIGVLVFLSMPIIGIWCMLEEFTPLSLSVKEGVLTASQIRIEYEIPLEEIENVVWLEELPKLERISGTGMGMVKKGNYRVPYEGRCKVFLNPQNEYFIRIETADGVYYFSGADDEETAEVYGLLTDG